MGKINKRKIARKISKMIDSTETKGREIIDTMVEVIIKGLCDDGYVTLRNFGVFKLKKIFPRYYDDPVRNIKVFKPGSYKIKFSAGNEFSERVEGYIDNEEN